MSAEKRTVTIENRATMLGQGPWLAEPDHIEWRSTHGFVCIMHRQPRAGHWCGYVGVAPGHPWHKRDYSEIDAAAHGGLTYSEECAGDVCHAPEPGEPEHLWWVGFDCAHGGDLSPGHERVLPSDLRSRHSTYRDESYVRADVEDLAAQAKTAIANPRFLQPWRDDE